MGHELGADFPTLVKVYHACHDGTQMMDSLTVIPAFVAINRVEFVQTGLLHKVILKCLP
jgi:hypothetical protein